MDKITDKMDNFMIGVIFGAGKTLVFIKQKMKNEITIKFLLILINCANIANESRNTILPEKSNMKDLNTYDFNAVYAAYYKKSLYFVMSYVHDDMVAEDIVSDALVQLWKYLQERPIELFDGLLLTMLKNKSLNHLKQITIHNEVCKELAEVYQRDLELRIASLEECKPDSLYSSDILRIYEQTMGQMSYQTRTIFQMSRLGEKTNVEIANELGVNIKTVEYHITKALKVLRINLKDYLILLFLLY